MTDREPREASVADKPASCARRRGGRWWPAARWLAALVALYESTDGPNWVNNENWLTDAPLGEWYGVDTDRDGRVSRHDNDTASCTLSFSRDRDELLAWSPTPRLVSVRTHNDGKEHEPPYKGRHCRPAHGAGCSRPANKPDNAPSVYRQPPSGRAMR